jgi:hypothetical protein
VEGFDEVGKLGHGFSTVDELEEINSGKGGTSRPTYMSARRRRRCGACWRNSSIVLMGVHRDAEVGQEPGGTSVTSQLGILTIQAAG